MLQVENEQAEIKNIGMRILCSMENPEVGKGGFKARHEAMRKSKHQTIFKGGDVL